MKALLCTIYKGSKEAELYLFVEKKSGLTEVPQDLLEKMGEITEVMTLQITPERKLARVKAVDVLAGIEEKGFYLQLPPVSPLEAGKGD